MQACNISLMVWVTFCWRSQDALVKLFILRHLMYTYLVADYLNSLYTGAVDTEPIPGTLVYLHQYYKHVCF